MDSAPVSTAAAAPSSSSAAPEPARPQPPFRIYLEKLPEIDERHKALLGRMCSVYLKPEYSSGPNETFWPAVIVHPAAVFFPKERLRGQALFSDYNDKKRIRGLTPLVVRIVDDFGGYSFMVADLPDGQAAAAADIRCMPKFAVGSVILWPQEEGSDACVLPADMKAALDEHNASRPAQTKSQLRDIAKQMPVAEEIGRLPPAQRLCDPRVNGAEPAWVRAHLDVLQPRWEQERAKLLQLLATRVTQYRFLAPSSSSLSSSSNASNSSITAATAAATNVATSASGSELSETVSSSSRGAFSRNDGSLLYSSSCSVGAVDAFAVAAAVESTAKQRGRKRKSDVLDGTYRSSSNSSAVNGSSSIVNSQAPLDPLIADNGGSSSSSEVVQDAAVFSTTSDHAMSTAAAIVGLGSYDTSVRLTHDQSDPSSSTQVIAEETGHNSTERLPTTDNTVMSPIASESTVVTDNIKATGLNHAQPMLGLSALPPAISTARLVPSLSSLPELDCPFPDRPFLRLRERIECV